jgi:hypothetical protein
VAVDRHFHARFQQRQRLRLQDSAPEQLQFEGPLHGAHFAVVVTQKRTISP